MNDTQKIALIGSLITPFRAVANDADFVVVNPTSFGPPPSFQVVFGKLIPEIAAVPAVPAIPQKSGPNLPDYQPAVPAVPEVPAVPASFVPHRQESFQMTKEEWDSWDDSQSDSDYILSCVVNRYGIKIVVP